MKGERRGRLFLDGRLTPGTVRFADGRLTEVVPEAGAADPKDPIIAPGFLDLHVHGYGGAGPVEDLAGFSEALARVGTTAFQPTLFPDVPAELGKTAAEVTRRAQALPEGRGARVLGLHLEGPFVNPLKAGALPPEKLVDPSPEHLAALFGPATGDGRGIRTVTVAPELPGADDLITELVRLGVRVSLGHSSSTAAEARRAARAGAAGATHLYNAMEPHHHRDAGLLSFALSDDALFAELIGDLVHVGPEAVQVALRARGAGGLCLVSDALSGAGTGCSVFHSHGLACEVRDGAIWFDHPERGATLTGAAASQHEALVRLVGGGVVSLEEALRMATETPARALGVEDEQGRLVPGALADLVVLAPDLALALLVLPAAFALGRVEGSEAATDVRWSSVRADPAAFRGQNVRFVFQLAGVVDHWEPWLSRFDPERYLALEGWSDERFPWDAAVYSDRSRRLFVPRDGALERLVRNAPPLTRLEIEGHVTEIFLDEPWLRIDRATLLDESLTEGTLLHVGRARDLALKGQWDLALDQYERAEAAPLPVHARAELQRQIKAIEARRKERPAAPLGRPDGQL